MSQPELVPATGPEDAGPEIMDKEKGGNYVTGDDVGIAALDGVVENIDANGPEALAVLRKIDIHLLPLLCFTYLIQVIKIPCRTTVLKSNSRKAYTDNYSLSSWTNHASPTRHSGE
jgi:hypothetical protein